MPCPSPGELLNPGMEPTSLGSLVSLAVTGRFFTTKTTWAPISPILALIPLRLNINECLSIPLPPTTHVLSTHYVLDIVLGTEKYRTKYGPYLFK